MGFALWQENDCLVAAGTHEYRPIGMAIVGAGCVFSPRDFDARRRCLARRPGFVGLFASLGELNDYLRRSRSQARQKNRRRVEHAYLPYI